MNVVSDIDKAFLDGLYKIYYGENLDDKFRKLEEEAEKERVKAEKERVKAEKEHAEAEKAKQEKYDMIRHLLKLDNLSIDQIANISNLSKDEIMKLQKDIR